MLTTNLDPCSQDSQDKDQDKAQISQTFHHTNNAKSKTLFTYILKHPTLAVISFARYLTPALGNNMNSKFDPLVRFHLRQNRVQIYYQHFNKLLNWKKIGPSLN